MQLLNRERFEYTQVWRQSWSETWKHVDPKICGQFCLDVFDRLHINVVFVNVEILSRKSDRRLSL